MLNDQTQDTQSKLVEAGEQHHTEHTITVQTSVPQVFEVLADVEGYANLFPPTRSVTIMEETPDYQVAHLVVEVSGKEMSWITRRDIDRERHFISYQQLRTAPLMANMGGEWRCFPLDDESTQIVITHDFAARAPEDGSMTLQDADAAVQEAVERNSHADLAAVKAEAERRYHSRQ